MIGICDSREPVIPGQPVECPPLGRTVEPGMSAGARFAMDIDTREAPEIRAENDLRLPLKGERALLAWRLRRDSPAVATLTGLNTGLGTATHLVNRVPQVLAAAPELVALDRLGPPGVTP